MGVALAALSLYNGNVDCAVCIPIKIDGHASNEKGSYRHILEMNHTLVVSFSKKWMIRNNNITCHPWMSILGTYIFSHGMVQLICRGVEIANKLCSSVKILHFHPGAAIVDCHAVSNDTHEDVLNKLRSKGCLYVVPRHDCMILVHVQGEPCLAMRTST